MKKFISLILSLAIVLSCSSTVFASSPKEISVNENNLIEVFDPFVKPNNEGTLSLNVPNDVKLNISAELYQNVLTSLEITNNKIKSKTLKLMPDGTLLDYRSKDTFVNQENILLSRASAGGVNKTIQHWWGFEMWMDHDNADSWIFDFDQALLTYEAAAAAGTTVTAFIPVFGPVGSAAFGVVSLAGVTTMKLISNKAHKLNDNSDRGIVVNLWYTLAGTTVNPQ